MFKELFTEAKRQKAQAFIYDQGNGYLFPTGLELNIKGYPNLLTFRIDVNINTEAEKINKMSLKAAKEYIDELFKYEDLVPASGHKSYYHSDTVIKRGKPVGIDIEIKDYDDLISIGYEDRGDYQFSKESYLTKNDSSIPARFIGKKVKAAKLVDFNKNDYTTIEKNGNTSFSNDAVK